LGGLMGMSKPLLSSSLGFIDRNQPEEALQKAQQNGEASLPSLKRTQTLEFWFRHLTARGVLANPSIRIEDNSLLSLDTTELQSSAQPKSLAS